MRIAMSIAGSDSSAGAGIQADLKTFHSLGVYGVTALTAVTVQNTQGVRGIQQIEPAVVKDQILCLYEDMEIRAVKIGMVFSSEIVRAIQEALQEVKRPYVVLDPVMISKSGSELLQKPAQVDLLERLFPMADLVTPNLQEAEAITKLRLQTVEDMQEAARRIMDLGPARVVLKGGHLSGKEAVDVYDDGSQVELLRAAQVETKNTHGTGCTFSSAIAAHLALGLEPLPAVQKAKAYITGAIASSLSLGKGHGPVDHFWRMAQSA